MCIYYPVGQGIQQRDVCMCGFQPPLIAMEKRAEPNLSCSKHVFLVATLLVNHPTLER